MLIKEKIASMHELQNNWTLTDVLQFAEYLRKEQKKAAKNDRS